MDGLKNHLCDKHTQYKRSKKKKAQGNFSIRDMEELMGLHRPRYERRRGALRQKKNTKGRISHLEIHKGVWTYRKQNAINPLLF
jgi:hypothetical protein